jgi:6-phosphogluconolactonase
VEKVVRPTISVPDKMVADQLVRSPKMTPEQAKAWAENQLIRTQLSELIKGLVTTLNVQMRQDNLATAAKLYAKLLHQPKMKRAKNMSWILKAQMLKELTPEQAALKLVEFEGGAITLLDFMKSVHGMVPVKRPKNLAAAKGVEKVVTASVGGALIQAHIKSLGLQKDAKVAGEIRQGEDKRLMDLAVSRKIKPIKSATMEEAKAEFDKIKGKLKPKDQVKMLTIWCQDRDTAVKAKSAVDQGQAFEKVIEAMSLDPKRVSANSATETSETVFWSQIWSAEPNQVMNPMQGFFRGNMVWRVIKVLEKKPGDPVPTESQYTEAIRSQLYRQRKEAVLKPYQDELLKKYSHKIFESRVNAFNPLHGSPVMKGETSSPKPCTLYIGTATGGDSQGIYKTTFDAATGILDAAELVAKIQNPTFLALGPDGKRLVSIGETSQGKVFGFGVSQDGLKETGSQGSAGRGPCHVAVHPSGRWAVVSNYGSGTIASYPVSENGSPGPAVSQIQWEGTPRAHSATFSDTGRWVIFADLGNDRLVIYAFDPQTGVLKPAPEHSIKTAIGAGPRHTTFHPGGKFFYVANELNSTVSFYLWSEMTGELTEKLTLDLMDPGYQGKRSSADIHVSGDGKYLYVSNRGDANSITSFAINQDTGALMLVAQQPCGGKHPRNFTIDPSGRYLLVANRDTNNIVVFHRNTQTGKLKPANVELSISKPMCLVFQP